ncbi:M3 family metallopeptidase [Streptomyces sp. N2A]|uniref:M3 family metallopeptidase n=1 Tax=Streptomyces sp. N2A TaxID=3073936 RepID=UPI0028703A0B|nr:M3 family metallopeptidase [Streptomyces sp. N2A]
MTTITTRRPSYRGNLPAIAADLAAGVRRLRLLLGQAGAPAGNGDRVLGAEALREIVLIYSNASTTFAYLEGNQRYEDYHHLLDWHAAYFHDRDLTAATEKALAAVGPFTEREDEELRLRWLAWFAGLRQTPESARRRNAGLETEMRAVLRRMEARQSEFLQRLGINSAGTSPSVTLAQAASRLGDSRTRTKLTTAWRRHSEPDAAALTRVLDEAVDVRRSAVSAWEDGHPTVLAQTFQRCSVPPAEARSFLREFVIRARDRQGELESAIRAATGCMERPMDHFGRYLRMRVQGGGAPAFRLEACLELLATLARRVLGVQLTAAPEQPAHALTFQVDRGGEELGSIDFDLLRPDAPNPGPAPGPQTAGCGTPEPAKAKAHVLCRVHPEVGSGAGASDGRVSFAAAEAIFHEFGHALSHLLSSHRMPSESGVGHLPLERLECASTWWERWLYHPDADGALCPEGEALQTLSRARQLRALETWSTTLQCAVAAAVDMEVHGSSTGGHREAYERLSREFSLGDHCAFGDLPGYFTHLTWQAAPGAGFLYLWGAASSAEVFQRYQQVRLADLPAPGPPDELSRLWLDPALRSPRPRVESYFAFLRTAVADGPMEVAHP